jgi:Domain of unknown function (DUF1772)
MTASDVLWFVCLLTAGILAGGVTTTALTMIPALRMFEPDDDFVLHRTFNPLPDYFLPHCLFISALIAIPLLFVDDDLSRTGKILIIVGIATSVPVALISLLGNRRFNLVIRRWSQPGLPERYEERRLRWDRWHILRTILIIGVLACYAAAAAPERHGGPGGGAEWGLVVSLCFGSLVAGGLILVALSVVPTFHRVPKVLGVRAHIAVDKYIEMSLPALTVATIAAAAVTLAIGGELSTASKVLLALAIVSATWVALNSHLINRPMNKRIRNWPLDPLPDEYPQVRRRWDRWHYVRTVAGAVLLVSLVIALIAA